MVSATAAIVIKGQSPKLETKRTECFSSWLDSVVATEYSRRDASPYPLGVALSISREDLWGTPEIDPHTEISPGRREKKEK